MYSTWIAQLVERSYPGFDSRYWSLLFCYIYKYKAHPSLLPQFTYGNRVHSFDELFAFQILQNLLDLNRTEAGFIPDVFAPDSCSSNLKKTCEMNGPQSQT